MSTLVLLVALAASGPAPTVEQLAAAPGVANAEVVVAAKEPKARIIHLRNFSGIDPLLFKSRHEASWGHTITMAELVNLYELYRNDFRVVQLNLEATLRHLVKQHAVKAVLVEGVTSLAAYERDRILYPPK